MLQKRLTTSVDENGKWKNEYVGIYQHGYYAMEKNALVGNGAENQNDRNRNYIFLCKADTDNDNKPYIINITGALNTGGAVTNVLNNTSKFLVNLAPEDRQIGRQIANVYTEQKGDVTKKVASTDPTGTTGYAYKFDFVTGDDKTYNAVTPSQREDHRLVTYDYPNNFERFFAAAANKPATGSDFTGQECTAIIHNGAEVPNSDKASEKYDAGISSKDLFLTALYTDDYQPDAGNGATQQEEYEQTDESVNLYTRHYEATTKKGAKVSTKTSSAKRTRVDTEYVFWNEDVTFDNIDEPSSARKGYHFIGWSYDKRVSEHDWSDDETYDYANSKEPSEDNAIPIVSTVEPVADHQTETRGWTYSDLDIGKVAVNVLDAEGSRQDVTWDDDAHTTGRYEGFVRSRYDAGKDDLYDLKGDTDFGDRTNTWETSHTVENDVWTDIDRLSVSTSWLPIYVPNTYYIIFNGNMATGGAVAGYRQYNYDNLGLNYTDNTSLPRIYDRYSKTRTSVYTIPIQVKTATGTVKEARCEKNLSVTFDY